MTDEPAWLTAAVDQQLAKLKHMTGNYRFAKKADVVMMMLNEPVGPDGGEPSRAQILHWENACDRCDKFDLNLHTGTVEREGQGVKIIVVYGVCSDCLVKP